MSDNKKERKDISKKKNMFVRKQICLEGDTILEQFHNYIKENKKISNIIAFLSVQNSRLISLVGTNEGITF